MVELQEIRGMKIKLEMVLDPQTAAKFEAVYKKCFSLPAGHEAGKEHAAKVLLEIGIDALYTKIFGEEK
jgi:hypothetical protein